MTESVNVTLDIASYGMSPAEFVNWLRGGLGGEFEKVADDIEAQFPRSTIEEPQEFGSIVRATCGPGLVGILWQKAPWQGKHYWESETGAIDVWSELTDVEVVRVGIGERPDVLPKDTEDYKFGQSDVLLKLRWLWEEAITSERKNAFEVAIATIEELQP